MAGDRWATAQQDTRSRTLAARAALRPWLDSLGELERWFAVEAGAIWADQPERRARDVLALLQATLSAMARGDEAIARPMPSPGAALEPGRIDVLTASPRPRRLRAGHSQNDRRRAAILDLALWNALRRLGSGGSAGADKPALAAVAAWLARPTPPAPGISPTHAYAATADARQFFGETVSGVIAALASKKNGVGMAAFAAVLPARPFDGGLPAVVAWSHAWSAAVAGVYLDNLRRHANDDLQQAMRDIWSGRLSAVRFRTGPGLTALPSRDGALHLDLWTCAVKAQALAFDPAVWAAQAAGTQWHGVRVDMHELSRRTATVPAAGAPVRRAAVGLGVESLYRAVFVDRLHEVLSQEWIDASAANQAEAADAAAQPRTITVEMDRPHDGQLPNLRLLLRWRDAPGGALRSSRAGTVTGPDAGASEASRRPELAEACATARALEGARLDWRAPARRGGSADRAHAGLVAVGEADLWDAIGPGAQWIDAALVACVDGAWYELPVVLADVARKSGESPRTAWWLPTGAHLPGLLDAPTLQRAAREGAMRWSVHERGLGAFLMAAIDVDAWRLARPA